MKTLSIRRRGWKKTVTQRQLAANRANALKSTGPKTEEGKRRSKFNALIHGLTASSVVIPAENAECYDVYRHDYAKIFTPRNVLERQIVDDLCSARWMKERAVRHETALMHEAVAKYQADIRKTYPGVSEPVEPGIAFRLLSENSNVLPLLVRYHVALSNHAIKVWNHLIQVKRTPVAGAADEAANAGPPAPYPEWPYPESGEPIPENGHPVQLGEKNEDNQS